MRLILFMALLIFSSITAAFLPGTETGFTNSSDFTDGTNLTEEEKQSLIYMREEEKLARDVYLKMLDKYNVRVFNNISAAELRHMGFVKDVMDKYSVDDPVKTNDIGVFSNSTLGAEYNRLIEQGNLSLIDALKAGAEIEEMDISDINKELLKVSNKDIIDNYTYLKNGSGNHLRAFMRNITRRGSTYEPKHLSKEEFELIRDKK